MCEASATGIEKLDALELSPPPLYRGGLFFYLMNKTKKRAAKRAAKKPTVITPVRPTRRQRFNWTFPLDSLHKIANLKCYRAFHGCTLGEAKTAVETAMDNLIDDQLCMF